jgi:chromosome segregation ATPase
MSFEQLVERLEKQVIDLGKRFVPGAAQSRYREEAQRLSQAIDEHEAHARHFRESVQRTRGRISEDEVREAVLASQVEAYIHTKEQAKAYPLALELEEVRRRLAEDRSRLPCDRKAYRMHRDRISELERRLVNVERKLRTWDFVG